MNSLYLLVDLFTILVPFLFSFHPKLQFYKEWKTFFTANGIVLVLFILWDILYVHLGVWGFNANYVLGPYLYNLPIEEILFFICIPYSCVFTYFCIGKYYSLKWNSKMESIFVWALSISLFSVGIFNIQKLYTSSVFISLPILLIILKYVVKINWLGKLFSIYTVLLIPFSIVNGILTGSGIEKPVVWYNEAHNLGIRLFTIPFEDVFYGFELILLNVLLFEYLQSQKKSMHT